MDDWLAGVAGGRPADEPCEIERSPARSFRRRKRYFVRLNYANMLAHNVPCIQPPTEVFGTKIAQYLDPDRLSISVSEERRDKSFHDGAK